MAAASSTRSVLEGSASAPKPARPAAARPGQPRPAKPARMISLDAFRGFTIASMVLVNNPGDWGHLHPPLAHAKWNGWTFTDLIFPFFLFIGGVSMTFSLGRRAEAGDDKPQLLWKLAKRAAIIFLIGLALNLIPSFDLANVRIPGVLQRIALCTMLAAPIVVYTTWRQQCGIILGILAAYTCLLLFLPVPDTDGHVVAGALQPGRDVGAFVDRLVFGRHVWATAKTWDPEGLVSTLPAVCSQLLGVLTGRWLATAESSAKKTGGMVLAGVACIGVAAVIDATFMPINKSLWTTSYCIAMTGWALLVFSAFYWLMDANGSAALRNRTHRAFLPFTIYGMNALFIFAFSGLFAKMLGIIKVGGEGAKVSVRALIYGPIKALPIAPVNASLLFAVLFNLAMFAVAWGMWKKKWFVKV